MTVVSRIAKHSIMDGGKQVVFHLACDKCRQKNLVQLGAGQVEIRRHTCGHFHSYNLAFLKEGVVYFQFAC